MCWILTPSWLTLNVLGYDLKAKQSRTKQKDKRLQVYKDNDCLFFLSSNQILYICCRQWQIILWQNCKPHYLICDHTIVIAHISVFWGNKVRFYVRWVYIITEVLVDNTFLELFEFYYIIFVLLIGRNPLGWSFYAIGYDSQQQWHLSPTFCCSLNFIVFLLISGVFIRIYLINSDRMGWEIQIDNPPYFVNDASLFSLWHLYQTCNQ